MVIAGNAKNKTGKVVKVLVEKQRVVVEGLNMVKKHMKPTAESPQGGIIEKEGSIHISNVMPLDPKTGKPRASVVSSMKRANCKDIPKKLVNF